jgi:holo-[acyl-carrier protein] synthase
MILGIGIDIVDLSRFKNLMLNKEFLDRYFSKSESKLNLQSLAGRFAAREALYKALSSQELYKLENIEIINTKNGAPKFIFYNELANFFNLKKIHLSISHLPEYAISIVIIED